MNSQLFRPLASLRLTLWLLVALCAVFLLGLWIPQEAVLRGELYAGWAREHPYLVGTLEALGLTAIHGSVLVGALWTAFFANLLAALGTRVPGILKRLRLDGGIPAPRESGFPARCAIPAAVPAPLAAARAFFASRGYVVAERDGRLRAVRNRLSPLGTILFHASFLVILAGAAASSLTRFEGIVNLGTGETFTGDLGQYARPPRIERFARRPAGSFLVEGIVPEVVGDVPVRVRVVLRDARYQAQAVEVNAPYVADDGTTFVFKDIGIAPLLVVDDGRGNELGGAYMRLDVGGGKTDQFQLMGQKFEARFFPDWVVEQGEDATRSQEPNNPALQLTILTKTGRRVTRTVRPGEKMELGPYRLAFREFRYWVKLYVRSERGTWVVFAGFALATLALVWRLVWYRRDWIVAEAAEGSGLEVAARSDFYRALFADEFEREAADLARALEGA